jgi:Phosphotransferase enzyme family
MLPIPLDVADLSCDWLTYAVQGRAPGAVVTAVTVVDAHSGTTGRARLAVTCDDDRVPATVFVKLAPFTQDRRAFVDQQGMGVAEARFYNEVAADVPVHTPDVFLSEHDVEGRYIMVFEDLLASGARYPTAQDDDIAVTVDGVIDNFAALHAAFHCSDRFASDGDLAWIELRSRGYGSAAPLVEHAVSQIGSDMPAVFHEFVEMYVPNADRIAALLARGDRTLVHGDSHIGNMFVAPAGVGFLDWAVLGFAPGMRDLAYFIGNSVSTEFRREHERRLVSRYCDALQSAGVELEFEVAWMQYRLQMTTGWIAAVVTAGFGSALQPIEIGLRATERANTALVDLDVIEVIASQL